MPAAARAVFLLPSFTAGGAERVLITLMNGIDRAAFAPELVVVCGEGPLRGLVAPGIPVRVLGKGGGGAGVLRALPGLCAALRRARPDIVVSTMAHMNFAALLLRPFFPGTRFIVREAVTPSYILEKRPVLAPFLRLAYRALYPLAGLVICPARAVADELAALAPGMKACAVLPNPVDVAALRGAAPVLPPRGDPGTVHFICAGRLVPQKGFDRLIEILPRLRTGNWRLTVLGEGPERGRLEAAVAAAGLADRVFLPGHSGVPWPMIAGCDAFLLPSRFEGLPNAALEALACGTPVIAAREAGGIAEIAAQAPPGAVTLAADMDAFLAAMEDVKPGPPPAGVWRLSLLPPAFEKDGVLRRFTAFLKKEEVPPAPAG